MLQGIVSRTVSRLLQNESIQDNASTDFRVSNDPFGMKGCFGIRSGLPRIVNY